MFKTCLGTQAFRLRKMFTLVMSKPAPIGPLELLRTTFGLAVNPYKERLAMSSGDPNVELLELWDAVGGFQLDELLIEIIEAPIPFIDFEPKGREPRKKRYLNTRKPS